MTAANHAVTGSLVAVAIGNPVLALSAALASHFVLDSLPHWDYKLEPRLQRLALIADVAFSFSPLLLLSVLFNDSASLIIVGGLLGMAPDALWLPDILRGKPSPMSKKTLLYWLRRAHQKIQWSERPWGWIVELVWFIGTLVVLVALVT